MPFNLGPTRISPPLAPWEQFLEPLGQFPDNYEGISSPLYGDPGYMGNWPEQDARAPVDKTPGWLARAEAKRRASGAELSGSPLDRAIAARMNRSGSLGQLSISGANTPATTDPNAPGYLQMSPEDIWRTQQAMTRQKVNPDLLQATPEERAAAEAAVLATPAGQARQMNIQRLQRDNALMEMRRLDQEARSKGEHSPTALAAADQYYGADPNLAAQHAVKGDKLAKDWLAKRMSIKRPSEVAAMQQYQRFRAGDTSEPTVARAMALQRKYQASADAGNIASQPAALDPVAQTRRLMLSEARAGRDPAVFASENPSAKERSALAYAKQLADRKARASMRGLERGAVREAGRGNLGPMQDLVQERAGKGGGGEMPAGWINPNLATNPIQARNILANNDTVTRLAIADRELNSQQLANQGRNDFQSKQLRAQLYATVSAGNPNLTPAQINQQVDAAMGQTGQVEVPLAANPVNPEVRARNRLPLLQRTFDMGPGLRAAGVLPRSDIPSLADVPDRLVRQMQQRAVAGDRRAQAWLEEYAQRQQQLQ